MKEHLVEYNRFPGGKLRCLTMSYDDGRDHDIRLAEIFRENGIVGTFHLTSSFLDRGGYVKSDEIKEIYKGHEISAHTRTHPFLDQLPDAAVLTEILDDRLALEAASGTLVRGMSYPFGVYDDRVVSIMKTAGVECARTIVSTQTFDMPKDFLRWHPTCHHKNGNIMEKLETFLAPSRYTRMRLFYIWGHSYEFANDNNWELIEEFCKRAGGDGETWYASNIEIVDYMKAVWSLQTSASCDMIRNPSAVPVWIEADGEPLCIASGETVKL